MKLLNALLSADAHRALELLEDYHSQLTNATERPLRSAIERVIRIFKSRLFQALLGNISFFLVFYTQLLFLVDCSASIFLQFF